MNLEWILKTVVLVTYLSTNCLGIIILSVFGAIYARRSSKSKQEIDAYAAVSVVSDGNERSLDNVSPAEQTVGTVTTTNKTTSATLSTTTKNEKAFLRLWANAVYNQNHIISGG